MRKEVILLHAKEYLQQIRKCDNQINNKISEIVKLKEMATSITPTLKDVAVSNSGGVKSRVAEAVDKIIDLENEINSEIDRLVNLKREIMSAIDRLEYPHREILYKRYFQYKTWEQIATEMGFTYQWICKLHSRALQKVQNEFEKVPVYR